MFSNFQFSFFFCFEIKIFKKAESWNQMQIPFNEKKKIDCCSIWKISSSSAHKILGILTHRRIIKLVDLPNRKIKSFGFIYIPSHLDEKLRSRLKAPNARYVNSTYVNSIFATFQKCFSIIHSL